MPAKPTSPVSWLNEPEDQDYPAAASYLGLLHSPKKAAKLVAALRTAPLSKFKAKAKDIF